MRVKGTRDIAKLRDATKREIDGAAEALRSHPKLLTPGSGMALTYKTKELQAREFLATPDWFDEQGAFVPANYEPGTYPLLDVSVGIEGDDVYQVARIVQEMADQWIQAAAAIEGVRLSSKNAVDAAATPATIAAAKDQAIAGFSQIAAMLSS